MRTGRSIACGPMPGAAIGTVLGAWRVSGCGVRTRTSLLKSFPAVGLVSLALALSPLRAQEPVPAQTFRIEAVMEGVSPATGRDGVTYRMKAYLGHERTRVDLDIPGAENVYLLLDNATGAGWAIGKQQDGALPVTADAYRELVVDPQAPCARLRARCQPIGQREIAGVRAIGMRYAGARNTGPGGSDRGDMWVDPSNGLVLAYDGRTRDRKVRRMRVTEARNEALPDALFELPAALGNNRAR